VLVLHAHLPYVRHPGHERFLEEEWLFEAVTEVYLPLIGLLWRLADDGLPARVGLVLSPALSEMLADRVLMSRYEAHVARLTSCAEAARGRLAGGPFEAAAAVHCERFERAVALYRELGGDVLAGIRAIEGRGAVELIGCPATHALLPLVKRPECVRAQIETGARCLERRFGRRPRGMWLPECAYSPGIDDALVSAGAGFTFLDAHGLMAADPMPRGLTYRPVVSPSGVAFFSRDTGTSMQVWSADHGYPGDGAYREFHRDYGFDGGLDVVGPCLHADGVRRSIGLKFHRVTSRDLPGERKEPYDPAAGRARAAVHAGHFVSECARRLAALPPLEGPAVVTAMYDAELFGHWWFEGPDFLEGVMRRLASSPEGPVPVTPSEAIERSGRLERVRPAASSWGWKGYFEQWLNDSNSWVYPLLHEAEDGMLDLARLAAREGASEVLRRAANQAARELMLAQASDWAFLMSTGTAPEYAGRRTRLHLASFDGLRALVASGALERDRGAVAELERMERAWPVFPEMDFRVFLHEDAPGRRT
jgi:1,4-alpha-glucan branching enzyme